jgi:D-3-phosphoglycerate dehydrogenase
MALKKLLIVDDLHPVFKQEAEKLGYVVDDYPLFTYQETLKIIDQYTGLAIRTKFNAGQELIDAGVNLRFIARAGSGMDNVDEVYALSKGIQCINAPEGNRDAVGEHVIGMLLALMNNLNQADAEIRNGIWDRESNRGHELKGKTIGIIGYGNTGQSLAKKLKGFEVNVIAYDKYKTGFTDMYAKEADMEDIVKQTDILSLHIPLTSETKQLVDDKYISRFRKPVFLVNTSRGEIVKTQAVLKGIKENTILAAGFDVLEVERFPALEQQEWFNELKESPKVLLSPHVAGWTFESYRKISEVLAEKLKDLHF